MNWRLNSHKRSKKFKRVEKLKRDKITFESNKLGFPKNNWEFKEWSKKQVRRVNEITEDRNKSSSKGFKRKRHE